MSPTPRCERFEREFLERLDLGLPLDPHVESCEECRAARDAYTKVLRQLRVAGAARRPPGDWEARVFARLARTPRRRRWPRLLSASLLGVAAVLILLLSLRPGPVALDLEVRPGDGQVRGQAPHPGDRLLLHARTGSSNYAELRVYRNERDLVLQKTGERGRIEAELRLPSVGRYRALLLVSGRPLPAETSSVDEDAGRALAAGAATRLSLPIDVW